MSPYSVRPGCAARPNRPRAGRLQRPLLATGVLAILLLGSMLGAVPGTLAAPPVQGRASGVGTGLTAAGPWIPVPDSEAGAHVTGAVDQGAAHTGSLLIVVTLQESHPAQLNRFLQALSTPGSPAYHHYLTAAQFDAEFGGPANAYRGLTAFFRSYGVDRLTTYADRLTLTFEATPAQIQDIFHVSVDRFRIGDGKYVAAVGAPSLPASLAGSVAAVEGLSTYSSLTIHPASLGSTRQVAPPSTSGTVRSANGYLPPVSSGGVQLEYAPDFQIAYDEPSLFNASGYPTSAVVATILWAGTNRSGTAVGPFDPSDVYDFYNETLPAGEPHPHLYGVPLNGAAVPGISASYDNTGANFENTLDLEMVGSTAPGASIYNVYGPNATYATIDAALAYILNPNSSTPGLANVSVITNSWGGHDANDSSWYTNLKVAQARGISVLASSGDSGDNPNSSKWVGSNTEFPSSMAYDTFGVTAVGGTTAVLHSTVGSANYLHLKSQIAWNVSTAYAGGGGPAGSSGGISKIFHEPSWQLNTSANGVIHGAGRATPDIAAIANNTLITISVDGARYYATNATHGGTYELSSGTSIASPLTAGLIAEIDHVLSAQGDAPLGFLNPDLYDLANQEYAALTSTSTTGYSLTGSYNSSLPVLPLMDVTRGQNYLYPAGFGYDLVTGWGSIDAYNYTVFFLTNTSTTPYGRLAGVSDVLTLQNLAVTSEYPNGTVNTNFNASIQQNFFLADGLGAPIYWVQNVIYMTNTSSGWYLTYTGWVIYPFYGQYPSLTIYAYNYPAGQYVTFPARLNVTSQLLQRPGFQAQEILFTVQNQSLTLPVPGASYILGSLSTNYSWQGVNYSNGPYPNNPTPGGLAPQFGLVGGPSLGAGNFTAPTAGNLTVAVEPLGQTTFVPANTAPFGLGVTETGETALNEGWSSAGGSRWTLGISPGNTTQGILGYEPINRYHLNFHESGLPAGQSWSVTLNGTTLSSTSSQISFVEPNGSYAWSLGPIAGYHTPTYTGTVTVHGANVTVNSTWVEVTYGLRFTATGLPAGTVWWLNITGGTSHRANATGLNFTEPNGTYHYTVASARPGFQAPGGSITVAGANRSATIAFAAVTYSVAFTEHGLPSGTLWSVTFGNRSANSTGSTITVSAANGTYNWSVGFVSGYRANRTHGTLNVNGSASSIGIDWSVVNYTVRVNETGLPAGTLWWLNLTSGASYSSTAVALNLSLPNGTYAYTLGSANPDYAGSPGNLSVRGANQTVDVRFNFIAYTLSFESFGLANGTLWSVSVDNRTNSSTSDWVNFTLLAGAYLYRIAGISGWTTQYSGRVTMSANYVLGVTWTRTTYPVEFTVQGLPSGSIWSVTVNGTVYSSDTTQITVPLLNGSYPFSFGSVAGYSAPPGGTLTVQGSAPSVTAQYAPFTFLLTVFETGLPAGATWWLNITGGPSTISNESTLQLRLPNGTYSYTATTLARGYGPLSGTLTVNGTTPNLTLSFGRMNYSVRFLAVGLPSGIAWSVDVNGSLYVNVGSTVTFAAPNGVYDYTVGAVAGWTPQPSSGQVAVDGAPVNVTIDWVHVTYAVTFEETGLPSGTPWSVTFDGTLHTTQGTTLRVMAANGTGAYRIQGVPGYALSAYTGSVTVSGAPVNVPLTWTRVTYALQLLETGLPSGTYWSVGIGNGSVSGSSSRLVSDEPNGTYLLTPLSISGYSVAPTTVRVVIQGGAVSESFTYRATSSAPAGSTFFGLPLTPTEGYALIGAIVVVVAVGVAVGLLRGRRRGASP